jgi:hypothetical protein
MGRALPLLPLYAIMAWTGPLCLVLPLILCIFFPLKPFMHVELYGAATTQHSYTHLLAVLFLGFLVDVIT